LKGNVIPANGTTSTKKAKAIKQPDVIHAPSPKEERRENDASLILKEANAKNAVTQNH
jgi:hypothetical protein